MYVLLYGCTVLKVRVMSAFEMLFVILFQNSINKCKLIFHVRFISTYYLRYLSELLKLYWKKYVN